MIYLFVGIWTAVYGYTYGADSVSLVFLDPPVLLHL
jgi:hypothetical protein